ncbi:YciI family protein [Streptomyces turgidiscabies]|uniref:DGPF domain protein n=1 Tax=Streptomyces turgidiscabies (strain Car8) TaxID=698760 RepID=L7F1A6_STRT8|nr:MULTISPECIES: YciI family protein [Streptomyces]ELP64375.1 DGPF domain protein [Streptomyces turgidiscabies Car8]MDX3495475.1 YciI family protein [Streptomyces turgidiscabies]GAQ70162.1 YCII-related domain protein [Streptomyces turgidiscabies]
MKYLVTVRGTQADYDAQSGRTAGAGPVWTEDDLRAMYAYMGAINADLAGTGEFLDGNGLAEPARIRQVRAGADGGTVITDGPYGDTEVLMAGYWLLECASLERVTEIAARVTRCPVPEGAAEHPVEIRPVMDGDKDGAGDG